jgi:hypothetical protein
MKLYRHLRQPLLRERILPMGWFPLLSRWNNLFPGNMFHSYLLKWGRHLHQVAYIRFFHHQEWHQDKETPDSEMGLPPKNAHATPTTRRSSAPALIRLFFIAVRLLLLVQFVLTILHSLFHWQDNALWVSVVYILSPVFIWPVRILIQQIPLPFSLWPELYTLLAIVFYSILSRILVRLVKWITRYR